MNASKTEQALIYRLVALGFLVMCLSTSVKSVYQVYFGQLTDHFGGKRADLAWAGAIFMLVTGLMSPIVGALSDRFGPLRTVLLGVLVGGAALITMCLQPESLVAFVLAYGVGAAFAMAAMTYVPMGILVDRLFEQTKKGLAYAVVTNGTSIGFIVLSPFWIWIQPQVSWTTTFLATGIIFVGPIAALVWLAARSADAAGLGRAPLPSGNTKPSAWREVRSDPGFYVLAFGFFGCGATMAFVDVHLVAYWQDAGTSRSQMGLSMSLLGVLELASGLLTGWLAIRCGKHSLLAIFYALRSVAMCLLLSDLHEVQTVGFATIFGASYLGTVVLTSMYCFERYGGAIKGQVFGMLFLVHQLGAFASVRLGAASFDASGNYRTAIVALTVVTISAAVTSWFGLRRPSAASLRSSPTLKVNGAVQSD
jgi:MFS family permease